jgi:hypothetical protein
MVNVKYQVIVGDGVNVIHGLVKVADIIVKEAFTINNVSVIGDGSIGSCSINIIPDSMANWLAGNFGWGGICWPPAVFSNVRGVDSFVIGMPNIKSNTVLRVYIEPGCTMKRVTINISGVA